MIVTSVQIKTAKTQKHLYCLVFTKPLSESSEVLCFNFNIKYSNPLSLLYAR